MAVLALDYLRGKLEAVTALPPTRPQTAPKGGYASFAAVLKAANAHGIEGGGEGGSAAFGGCLKAARTGMPGEVDVFTNDYFTFKTMVQAKAIDTLRMRENGEGGSVACTVPKEGGGEILMEVRSAGDFFCCKDWIAEAIATADRTTGVMSNLHPGMLSLYVLLTHRQGAVTAEQAEYVRSALEGRTAFFYNEDGSVARVKLALTAEVIGKRGEEAKVVLMNYMEFQGYAFTDKGYDKSGGLPKQTRWWEGVEWQRNWGTPVIPAAPATVTATSLACAALVPPFQPLVAPASPFWPSIDSLFSSFDAAGVEYAILRNFEVGALGDPSDKHPDVDLIVSDFQTACCVATMGGAMDGARKNCVDFSFSTYGTSVRIGKRTVKLDFRVVGDGYYSRDWEAGMLERRVRGNVLGSDAYSLSPDDYFFSLLYHVVVHKEKISRDYPARLCAMAKERGLAGSTLSQTDCGSKKALAEILWSNWMRDKGFGFAKPLDVAVWQGFVAKDYELE